MNWWTHRFFLADGDGPPAGGGPASGGASAPAGGGASAPAPEGATPPEGAEAAPSHDPFSGMESNDYDVVELEGEDSPTGDEPGGEATPPAAVAEGEPPAPATATPPVTPQAQPAPPTAPVAPAGDAPASPRSPLDAALEGFKGEGHAQLANWASQNLFKLSEAEATALDTDAVAAIPKLMGRVYTQAMESTINLIKNLVPDLVNSGISTQQTRAQRASEALNEFYQSNPHLSADKHGAAVDRWARSFRAANPSASRADAIAFVGRAVSAEFGVWPSQNGSGAVRAKQPASFVPARQGGKAPPSPKGQHDPYAGMEDEYD